MKAVYEARFHAFTMILDLNEGLWQPSDTDRIIAAAMVAARNDNDGQVTSQLITGILDITSRGFEKTGPLFQLLTHAAEFVNDPEQRDSTTGQNALTDINRLLDNIAALPPVKWQ